MPLPRRDFFDFLFNGGRGIRGSQLTEDAGKPTYVATAIYDVGTNVITLSGEGVEASPAFPWFVHFFMPANLPRAAAAIEVRLGAGGTTYPLLTLGSAPVAARDITPGCLHGVLRGYPPAYYLLDPLAVRPQDFNLVLSWLPTPPYGQAEMEAYVNDSAHHGVSMTDHVILPAFVPDGRMRANQVVGVPLDAPDFDRFQGQGTFVLTVQGTRILPWDGRLYNGIGYKWWVLPSVTVDVPGAGFMAPSDYFAVFLPY